MPGSSASQCFVCSAEEYFHIALGMFVLRFTMFNPFHVLIIVHKFCFVYKLLFKLHIVGYNNIGLEYFLLLVLIFLSSIYYCIHIFYLS